MAYTENPVWMFPPNWGSPVSERLDWRTDVLSSESGAEQRLPRRLTPRRTLSALFYLTGPDRQQFENYIAAHGASRWAIPLWFDISTLSAPVSSGADTISVDTQDREFVVGGLVVLRGKSLNSWEIGVVESLTTSSITLVDPLENSWPKETKVYPGRVARVLFALDAEKKTDDFIQLQAKFLIDQINPYRSDIALTTYLSSPVLETRPDDSEELSFGFERMMATVDNDHGIPAYEDVADRAFQTVQYRWSIVGRQKTHQLRQFLSYLRGRARAVWVPTFMADFSIDADVANGATFVAVKNVGYTDSGALAAGREHIRIELRSGVNIHRRITASAVASATRETLTLDTPIATGFLATDVVRISFMQLSRMTEDSIELMHPTDSAGLTQCAVTWRGPTNY